MFRSLIPVCVRILVLVVVLLGMVGSIRAQEKPKLTGLTYMETMDPNHFKYHYQPDAEKDAVVGYLGLPKGLGPFRVVIAHHSQIGNAKQVAYNYGPEFLDRGYAFLTLDLKYASKPEESDWKEIIRKTSACLEIIESDSRLDASKVYMFGNGVGAMTALVFAAQSDKLRALGLSGSGMMPKDGVDFSRVSAPAILVHGETDQSVPLEAAQKLKANLERAGKKAELKVFEKSGHEVITLKANDVYDVIVAFFNSNAK